MGRRERQRAEFERFREVHAQGEPTACALCRHQYDRRELTRHHVVPKSRGGTDIELLCPLCHKQVHALFTERELEEHYGTLDKLESAEPLQPFLRFVRKRKPTKSITVKSSRTKGR